MHHHIRTQTCVTVCVEVRGQPYPFWSSSHLLSFGFHALNSGCQARQQVNQTEPFAFNKCDEIRLVDWAFRLNLVPTVVCPSSGH